MSMADDGKAMYTSRSGFKITKNLKWIEEEHRANLSPQQIAAVNIVVEGRNTFVHGPAGTGKSAIIREMTRIFRELRIKYALCAPTGAAAVAISGQTIHSLFRGCGRMDGDAQSMLVKLRRMPQVILKIRQLGVFIIDEISMVSAEFLQLVSDLLSLVRRDTAPFGGLQVVVCGDFYQLPPIIDKDSKMSPFAFNAPVWDDLNFVNIELTKIFRQCDKQYVDVLNKIRVGDIDMDVIATLITRVDQKMIGDGLTIPTSLCATNRSAEEINERELAKLPGQVIRFNSDCTVHPMPGITEAQVKELYHLSKAYHRDCIPSELNFKIGAQVMLRVNLDVAGGLANGSRGVVVNISDAFITVQFNNGTVRTIWPAIFKNQLETGVITVEQIPCILAWAMTIHKSQGSSIDLLEVNMQGIRTDGQAYVALSRVRTLSGLFIRNFNPKAFKTSAVVQQRFEDKV